MKLAAFFPILLCGALPACVDDSDPSDPMRDPGGKGDSGSDLYKVSCQGFQSDDPTLDADTDAANVYRTSFRFSDLAKDVSLIGELRESSSAARDLHANVRAFIDSAVPRLRALASTAP